MTIELTYLAMYGLFVLVLILAQVGLGAAQHGLIALAGNRDGLTSTGMAARAERAVTNSVIAMALIAPAVLMATAAGITSAGAVLAMQIFLTARIAYAVVYFIGIPMIRTLLWIIGFLCTGYLYLALV